MLLSLLCLLPLLSEPNDTMDGAVPFTNYGSGKLDYSGDPEWFRIKRTHGPAMKLDIMTGWGALCACPKGDPFIVELELFDKNGVLLFSKVATTPGYTQIQIPLGVMPLGDPVWMKVTGTTVGPYGWGDYQVMVF
jgi:hypothetical protein